MRAYLTLDFEEDLGSAARTKTFLSHRRSQQLIDFVENNDLRVTLFVTGEIIEEHPDLLAPYQQAQHLFEFELHAYDHRDVSGSAVDRVENARRGVDAYVSFFGRKPLLFRAPDGVIGREEVEFLTDSGIHFGSNLFPTFFPGRFNNLHVPRRAFRMAEVNFTEIPFSVTRLLRAPISASYVQLLGFLPFRALLGREQEPDVLIDFHLHDLFPGEWYATQPMSALHKVAYFRASRPEYAFATFARLVGYFGEQRASFRLLGDLVETLEKSKIQELSLSQVFKSTGD